MTTTDQVCVTCGQPIAMAPISSEYYHLTVDWSTLGDPAREHRAQPLAQPARSGGSNG